RRMAAGVYLGKYLDFVHNILGRYHPARVIALYPLYIVVSYVLAVGWIFRNSRKHGSLGARIGASLALPLALPGSPGRALRRPAEGRGRSMATGALRRAAVAGFGWSGAASAVQLGARAVMLVVLAKLLTPADLGLLGTVFAIIAILQGIGDLGLGPAIVQRG